MSNFEPKQPLYFPEQRRWSQGILREHEASMRVRCGGVEGSDIKGVVIGGEFYDADTGDCDLEDTFTVRCDDGVVFEVHGWMSSRPV